MANFSQLKKVTYVVPEDIFSGSGVATVAVLWDSPFNDTNYVVNVSVEAAGLQNIADVGGFLTVDYEPGNIYNLAPTGFTVGVFVFAPDFPTVSVHPLIVHAVGVHL